MGLAAASLLAVANGVRWNHLNRGGDYTFLKAIKNSHWEKNLVCRVRMIKKIFHFEIQLQVAAEKISLCAQLHVTTSSTSALGVVN